MRSATLTLIAGVVGAVAMAMPARAGDCDDLLKAALAQAKTPYAGSMTTTEPGKPPQTSAVVNTGDTMYVQVEGEWNSMPYNVQETVDTMNEKAKTAKQTCQRVGSETVNGQSTTHYTQSTETPEGAIDASLWVATSSGLPVKLQMRFKDGTVVTQETRYDHVVAPAGATQLGK